MKISTQADSKDPTRSRVTEIGTGWKKQALLYAANGFPKSTRAALEAFVRQRKESIDNSTQPAQN